MRNTDTFYPSWLPVEGPPWRLVNTRTGSFVRDKKTGKSLSFVTDHAAITHAKRSKLPLAAGVDKAAGSC